MVTDSLRYWVQEMHVDGFRFDLGTILAREPHGFDEQQRLPESRRAGPGAAQRQADRRALGLRPRRLPGRRASRPAGRSGTTSSATPCATSGAATAASWRRSPRACAASADVFNQRGRRPWASVNFITAHDGFTLNDLVTYNDKHNEANGEDNRDGNSDNRSLELRRRGTDRRSGDQRAARAPDAQHAGDAAAVAGHADAARRRRVRPHAGRQQQRLLPGQRDQLDRLG